MSMAGILSADPGLDRAQQIWHLRGDTDKVQSLGVLFFARRWPVFRDSPWNGPAATGGWRSSGSASLKHAGKGGYFSAAPLLPDGREPREATVDQIVRVLVEAGLATDRAAPERG